MLFVLFCAVLYCTVPVQHSTMLHCEDPVCLVLKQTKADGPVCFVSSRLGTRLQVGLGPVGGLHGRGFVLFS